MIQKRPNSDEKKSSNLIEENVSKILDVNSVEKSNKSKLETKVNTKIPSQDKDKVHVDKKGNYTTKNIEEKISKKKKKKLLMRKKILKSKIRLQKNLKLKNLKMI